MANYKHKEITGSQHKRANRVVIDNPYMGPVVITFDEEEVITIDNQNITRSTGSLRKIFTEDKGKTKFKLASPVDNSPLEQEATYQDVYILVHSLYLHLAEERDSEEVARREAMLKIMGEADAKANDKANK